MKVTLGQYLPGNTPVHRMDPRTKIVLTLFYMVIVLVNSSFIGYGILAAYLLIVLAAAKIKPKYVLKSMKSIIIIVLFTTILNLFFYRGATVLVHWKFITIYKEAVFFCISMALRILLLVVGASVMTYTTTSVNLTDGIEAVLTPLKVIGVPTHDIAMMMSIALKFIPIFADETDKIMKAQMARGTDFDSKNIFERVKSFVPVLVPLFVSAWRRADELANAMNARCYRGGEGRTRFRVLKFTWVDLFGLIVSLVFWGGVIAVKIIGLV